MTSFHAKIEIRNKIANFVGRKKVAVFDAFAGYGELAREAWAEVAVYVGCDKELYLDHRTMFKADNRRVLRCIDLSRFNIFDLDAYGSPWEQAMIIAARRPVANGEKIGMVLTVGEGLNLKLGGMPRPLRALTGLPRGIPDVMRVEQDILTLAIEKLAQRMNCRVMSRWQADKKGQSQIKYVGLALVGISDVAALEADSDSPAEDNAEDLF